MIIRSRQPIKLLAPTSRNTGGLSSEEKKVTMKYYAKFTTTEQYSKQNLPQSPMNVWNFFNKIDLSNSNIAKMSSSKVWI